jgi:hypothetical protein
MRAAPRMRLVSACDASYYRCVIQLLQSVERCDPCRRPMVVYDLGMTAAQRDHLQTTFQRRGLVEHRRFPFEVVPRFVGAHLRMCAWKPWIVRAMLDETGGPVLWLDSATVLLRSLDSVEQFVCEHGTWVPFGGRGTIGQRTHSATAAIVGASPAIQSRRMRAAGVCAFDPAHPVVRRTVEAWCELSLVEACIAPTGATSANHRYDQSLLAILLERAADEDGLVLPNDELDISSTRPTTLMSARNKVPAWVPAAADRHLWRFFLLRRVTNVWSNRVEEFLRFERA